MTTKLFIWYFMLFIVDVGNAYQKVLNKSEPHVMTINKRLTEAEPSQVRNSLQLIGYIVCPIDTQTAL